MTSPLVASLAEAWIEMSRLGSCGACVLVASLAEAWIEIIDYMFSILPE